MDGWMDRKAERWMGTYGWKDKVINGWMER